MPFDMFEIFCAITYWTSGRQTLGTAEKKVSLLQIYCKHHAVLQQQASAIDLVGNRLLGVCNLDSKHQTAFGICHSCHHWQPISTQLLLSSYTCVHNELSTDI